jgi:hypothetical protein
MRLSESRRIAAWCWYGLLWGVTLMANAALLSLLPLCLGWAAWRSGRVKQAFAAVAVVLLCCVPWTIRNYEVFHAFVPLRSVLGLQLWVGNNPDAKAMWLGGQHPIHETAEREKYVRMGELAYMQEKKRNAIAYIVSHPGHELELIGGRFVMFWSGGAEHPLDDFVRDHSAWFRYVLIFNLCASLGALAGIILVFIRRNQYAFLLAAGPVVFPLAYYMTLSLPRYRHPIDPTLMLLLAFAMRVTYLRLRSAPGQPGRDRLRSRNPLPRR